MMPDYFITDISEQQARAEKDKARALRKSRWWGIRISQGICHYCRERFEPADLTMDHVVPVIRGGRSVRSNIVPACKACNTKKKYLLPIEWEEYLMGMNSKDDSEQETEI